MLISSNSSGSDQLLSNVDAERLSQNLGLEELKVPHEHMSDEIISTMHLKSGFIFFSRARISSSDITLPPMQSLCDMLSAQGLSRVAQRRLAWSSLEAIVKAEEEQEKAREAARADSEVALKVNGPAYTKVFHGREMELISFAIMFLPLGCRSLCLIFKFY